MSSRRNGGLDVAIAVQAAVRGSGQGRQALELAEAVLRRGHRLTLYAHRVDDALLGRASIHRVRGLPAVQPVDDLLFALLVSRWCARARHDLVWAVGPTAVGRNVVFNAHFSHRGWRKTWGGLARGQLRARDRVYAWLLGALEGAVARRATITVVPAPLVGTDLGLPDDRFLVVPNGVDPEEFAPAGGAEREEARRRFGFSPEHTVVAFVGEYATPRKGLDPLLRALSEGPATERLLVTATGPREALLRRLAVLGLAGRVVVSAPGATRSTYAAADVVAVPSVYEPFSLVALEAAACGLPLVLARSAGAAALLEGAAKIVDDPLDPAQLRGALDDLEEDTARAAELGRRARERALALSWRACMDSAVDLMEQMAPWAGVRGSFSRPERSRGWPASARGSS